MQNNSIVMMYALSPCHAGSGSSMGVVDLPIQRERHTNWPVIQASGVKGAFRANFDLFKNNIAADDKAQIQQFEKLTDSIFGSSGNTAADKSGYAGSFSISDAKILAYPMRSNISPFVWIACPAILKRLLRDIQFVNAAKNHSNTSKVPQPETLTAAEWAALESSLKANQAIALTDTFGSTGTGILLEDYQVTLKPETTYSTTEKECIPKLKAPNGGVMPYLKDAEQLLLVSDEIFNYGVSDCTQITAKISIDSVTGVTKDGSLRYQEELPADTIMYSVVCWGDSKNTMEENLKAQTIRKFICEQVIADYIQIAGDETLGRGIFKLSWK